LSLNNLHMIKDFFCLLLTCFSISEITAQISNPASMNNYDTIKIESHISGLKAAILHLPPNAMSGKTPVLFIHGSSFPSSLAFGFRMNGYSWMDYMSGYGYDTYALDFPGYGNSDRYPEMSHDSPEGPTVGRAISAYQDIDSAVNYILQKTGSRKIFLIAHSWGASVAALYATRFPGKIERLVLFAPMICRNDPGKPDNTLISYDTMTPDARVDAMLSLTPAGEINRLEPEVLHEWKPQWLRSDPLAKGSMKGTVRFPAGPDQDIDEMQHGISYYDPSRIKIATLIIRGEWDTYPSNEDAARLFSKLTNVPEKKYVVIEKGTHVMHLEKSRTQLYQEVLNFLSNPSPLFNASPMPNTHSIAVIFEVIPADGKKQEYLDIAAKLKPALEKIDGFISIERFQSLSNPGKILSLSIWRDEQAIQHWRNLEMHRNAQEKGRSYVFKDYHLRIADVVRDYGMFDRAEAPEDSKIFHGKK
jgi:pimeloyl-ACP methyl ester carboxylesterase/heme-degrading monooxygenase HmoA